MYRLRITEVSPLLDGAWVVTSQSRDGKKVTQIIGDQSLFEILYSRTRPSHPKDESKDSSELPQYQNAQEDVQMRFGVVGL
ncbi:MAG: hypothetical protein WAV41_02685 [Microgenomates group bacterium]